MRFSVSGRRGEPTSVQINFGKKLLISNLALTPYTSTGSSEYSFCLEGSIHEYLLFGMMTAIIARLYSTLYITTHLSYQSRELE